MDLPFDARSPAARAAAPDPGRTAASPRALVVVLHVGRVARLTRARGVRVAVDAGRLWVTVAGVRDDVFLGPGDAATFGHEGTLVVESDGDAPAVFRLERAAPARATPPDGRGAALARCAAGVSAALAAASRRLRRARRARVDRLALAELDDATLRDLGAPVPPRTGASRDAEARRALRRTIDRCTW